MSKLSNVWRAFLERNFVRGEKPAALNEWQEAFCEWNAARLGLTLSQSVDRFHKSWAALRGGHGARPFKLYCELNHDLLGVFAGNRENEILGAYQAHAPLHFLRMLAYPVPEWPSHIPELAPLLSLPSPVIADFGCGLAQTSISLATFLRDQGKNPELFLADIPVPRNEFIQWLCRQRKLRTTFVECTDTQPLPKFPPCDFLIATEVFEHIHSPLPALEGCTTAIRPGGFLLTNVADHDPEFLHVSTNLKALRDHLQTREWREIRPNKLFQKTMPSPGSDSR